MLVVVIGGSFYLLVLLLLMSAQRGLRTEGTTKSNVCALALFLVPPMPFLLVWLYLSIHSIYGDAPSFFTVRYFALTMAREPLANLLWLTPSLVQIAVWAISEWRVFRASKNSAEEDTSHHIHMWPNWVIIAAVCLFLGTMAYLRNYTTLDEAVRRGNIALVERRLKSNFLGLGINNGHVSTVSSMLFLHPLLPVAMVKGDKEMALFLLAHGADKDSCVVDDVEGPSIQLALETPIVFRKTEMLEFMLQQGSDPNVRNGSGNTPLHIAADCQSAESAAILLKYGADPDIQNAKGIKPLELAEQEGATDVVLLLLPVTHKSEEE